MTIDYYGAVNCAKNLSSMKNQLQGLSLEAKILSDVIPSSYDGEGSVQYINVVEKLQKEIEAISSELGNLGDRIIMVADQICKEEEEEQRILFKKNNIEEV